jgi:hypothetical protein
LAKPLAATLVLDVLADHDDLTLEWPPPRLDPPAVALPLCPSFERLGIKLP